MTVLSHTFTLVPGTPEDVNQINQNDQDTRDWANGNIDVDNLTSATAGYAGLSQTGSPRRGKSIIPTEEARTNTAYGTLTTPDQVANIVLPTDGLIVVAYQALWKGSTGGALTAGIFLGSNQLKKQATTAPAVQECTHSQTVYNALSSDGTGLVTSNDVTAHVSDVTTGQIVAGPATVAGGACLIFAAAGTYTISVQFKAASGSVTAKERKLWVWTMGF